MKFRWFWRIRLWLWKRKLKRLCERNGSPAPYLMRSVMKNGYVPGMGFEGGRTIVEQIEFKEKDLLTTKRGNQDAS